MTTKIRIRYYQYRGESFEVAYYHVLGIGVFRLDAEFLDLFKTWDDLRLCDGQVPFVGY